MKVAFIHDWLVTYRGGERVLEALLEIYPEAPIFTLFYDSTQMPKSINDRKITTPFGSRLFRPFRKALLPFLPAAIESFDLSGFDLIISTSSCVAKSCLPAPGAKHLCYIHSPMRYVWDQREHYFKGLRKVPILYWLAEQIASRLRLWDAATAVRVDQFVANSEFVGDRVKRFYGRDSIVIHPPVDLAGFSIDSAPSAKGEGYFLAAGAWVSYKRFDLAIEACRLLGKRLTIMGSGPMENYIQGQSQGRSDIDIIRAPSREVWLKTLQGAKALLFPGTEEFGITAIEAMACGTPVIAHFSGGALDYVEPGINGLLFDSFTPECLASAIRLFDASHFNRERVAATTQRFSKEQFLAKMRAAIAEFATTSVGRSSCK